MAFSREFIFPEREREIQEERGIQEGRSIQESSREVKRARRSVSWVFTLCF